MKANQKGFSLVEILILIVVLGLISGAGWYVWQSNNKKQVFIDNSQTEQEILDGEIGKTSPYQSKLYPSLSFDVPSGWQVNEPAEYDESTWGVGSADSEITVVKDKTTLSLKFSTLRATGFEGYTCYDYKDLVKVKDTYRFTNKDGITTYRAGISSTDEDWVEASSGEFSSSEDSSPNYCVIFPFIATHKSTLNKKDFPDSPFNGVSTDVNDILVWVSADIYGDVNKDLLADTDTIISSFSDSIDW